MLTRRSLMPVARAAALSLASYAGLVAEACRHRPELAAAPKDWLIFGVSLVLLGLIQRQLLRRVRSSGEGGYG